MDLVDDARTELVERTLASPDPRVAGRVGHAIALFRGRAATEHDKRSAIFTLHLVLEERRKLLKASLFPRTRARCSRSRTSSTCAIRSPVTTTQHSWTGCSGGTWPPSSSPTDSSPARPPRPPPRRRDHWVRSGAGPVRADPLELAAELPLTEDEASYVAAARAPNTLRGYRSDWTEFTTWCTRHDLDPLPAAPVTISGYLTELARAEAKVGTMSRRLSTIRFTHQLRDLPDPTTSARVVAVWEGIRRTSRPGGPADASRTPRRSGRLPANQGVEDP